jgi:glucokinase
MDERLVLGVDIGGTKVAAGLVNARGEILFKVRVPMNVHGTAAEAMACVHQAIEAALAANSKFSKLQVKGIGVASPGPLDPATGIVLHTPNLPCWREFPLGTEIEHAYHLPTLVDNDANAAGLAEALWGAGNGFDSVFYATIGTGIGTAIVLGGKLLYGRTGAAAEGGHMTIDMRGDVRCGCGKRGCLEGLASGTGVAARAREKVAAEPTRAAMLLEFAGGDPAAITAEIVTNAWDAGDPFATEILRETADLLAIWFGNIVDLLEPEIIVIGGGLGTRLTGWFDYLQRHIPQWSINSRAGEIGIVKASYGADAGIAGSAALWVAGTHVTLTASAEG